MILARHDGPTGSYDARILARTTVIRVDLERLTDKVNPAYPGAPQV